MKPLRPILPGGNLWAEDENAKAAELLRLSKLQVEGGDLDQIAGGPQLRIPKGPVEFWAQIDTTNSIAVGDAGNEDGCSTAYGWVQQRPLPGGCWEDDPNGLSGTAADEPAFETKGATVTADAVVWLRRGMPKIVTGSTVQLQWLFEVGGAGSPEEICMPMAAGIASGARLYYPCVFVRLDVAADTWTEGPFSGGTYDCFLVQTGRRTSAGYALTVTSPEGPGRYSGIKQSGTKTLGGNTLPVYATVDGPYLGPDCQVRN